MSKKFACNDRMLRFEQFEERRMLTVPVLSSNPESLNIIHLDFDGHTFKHSPGIDTYWSNPTQDTAGNNGKDIHAPAYTIDAIDYDAGLNLLPFSDKELEYIEMAWKYIVEDFAPFDVNITTEEPHADAFTTLGGPNGEHAMRVVFTSWYDDSRFQGGTGKNWADRDQTPNTNDIAGVAPNPGLPSDNFAWNFNGDRPVWVFANEFEHIKWQHPDVDDSASFIWEPIQENMGPIASHEIGHGFGLVHDGIDAGHQDVINLGYKGDTPYYGGLGTGETGWGPIMGGAELRNLTQWSKLEYDHHIQDGGFAVQDDIDILAYGKSGFAGLGFREDDHSNVRDSTATHLSFIHNAIATKGGIIEGSEGTDNNDDGNFTNDNDIDVFHFDAGSTAVDITINVDPVAVGPKQIRKSVQTLSYPAFSLAV